MQPWQAVCALGEGTVHPVTVVGEEERGMATRTRGQAKRAGDINEGDGRAMREVEAEGDKMKVAQGACQSWHTDGDSEVGSDSDSEQEEEDRGAHQGDDSHKGPGAHERGSARNAPVDGGKCRNDSNTHMYSGGGGPRGQGPVGGMATKDSGNSG